MITAISVFIIVGFLLYFVILFNGLVSLKQNIAKAWSNIDVLLKQRLEELPNLVASVKGYMEYEQDVLEAVTKARSGYRLDKSAAEDMTIQSKQHSEMHGALKQLFAVAENYPALKANQSFLALQKRLSEIEDHIADRREYYNDMVTQFNIRIEQIPDLFIAKLCAYKAQELFRLELDDKADIS